MKCSFIYELWRIIVEFLEKDRPKFWILLSPFNHCRSFTVNGSRRRTRKRKYQRPEFHWQEKKKKN